ncbi:AarF/ABC1/UbiB kinase family protein [Halalkalibacter sp. APA_J-10(15)]|uniref:ABC1 kinase family protein n=1 Tax=Halalkalibacter sp. APA_J-10(15) TaxID=2933805 RepID=UPI001FF153C0|nr:AarF/ABC1/UbiB kinase family protein [Halalkalibacter sp. APA_J-10(15)]MCK0472857.1 AarF/ABC1/UbiB kinase family protein [Halalkalibacter sp. APA_J-10(15)]
MFEKRVRHLKRYREIAAAFSRNGFGFIVKDLGLHDLVSLPKRWSMKDKKEGTHSTGERIRKFLEELGPTFVKMGQLASTRPDLIPTDIIRELTKLQDEVPPFSSEEVYEIIESELGSSMSELFREFHSEPLGSASIGQVHEALLHTGERVAVKVQRPHINQLVHTDLEILHELVEIADHRLGWAAKYRLKEVVEEFSQALIAELDYRREGRNGERIARQFEGDHTVHIPCVYWDYTTKKVLTMEFVEGVKLNHLEALREHGYDTKLLAERVTRSILQQILLEGFFHGDPHPGNIYALHDNVVAFMDFGMVGRLTSEMKQHFATLMIAMMRQRTDGVIKAITEMGIVPDHIDMEELRADVEELRDEYYDVPFSQIHLGEAVHKLFRIAHAHRIQIPTNLTLVGKALLTLEGMIEKLDPELSIVKVAEPFGRELLKQRYHPKQMAEQVYDQWQDFRKAMSNIPQNVEQLTSITKKGHIPIEVTMPKLDMFLKKMDRISNRLSFSIVLLSFSIIMVGLIIGSALGGQASLLWNVPAVEIGFIVAILMFVWLLFSIFRSGRF